MTHLVSGDQVYPVKFGRRIPITQEFALAYGIIQPTEQEQAEMDARHAGVEQKRAAWRAETREWLAKLDAVTDPLARAVLDLHTKSPDGFWSVCEGCDIDGYEAEAPPWPCGTVHTVARHLGIPAPEHVELEDGS